MTDEEIRFVEHMERNLDCGNETNTERLCRIIRAYETMLAEGVVVTGYRETNIGWVFGETMAIRRDTHRARLVQIEEITPSPAQSDK